MKSEQGKQSSVAPPDTQSTSQAIKVLEKYLADLPKGDAYNATRDMLRAQILPLKQSIMKSKPLGSQRDGIVAVLQRAKS